MSDNSQRPYPKNMFILRICSVKIIIRDDIGFLKMFWLILNIRNCAYPFPLFFTIKLALL